MIPPFFSIIIPIYIVSKDLNDCLESILNQDFKDIEIIIIQRVSAPESKIELNKIFDTLPIKIITTFEKGIYTAMNLGVKQANGNWFLFLGQDDQFATNTTLKVVHTKIITKNQGIALGNVIITNRKSYLTPSKYANKPSILTHLKNTLHHQGIFYHSSIFNRYMYDENLNVLADYKLNLILLKSKIEITYLEILISKCSGSGISKNFNKLLYIEEKKIKKELYPLPVYFILCLFIFMKRIIKTSLAN